MRKIIALSLLGLVVVNQLACARPTPRKERASQLLLEIRTIAERSYLDKPSSEILPVIERINENKKGFPKTRSQLVADAALVSAWLAEKETESRIIDAKWDELIGMASEGEAKCFRVVKELSGLEGIEQGSLVAAQYRLFSDESIINKDQLDLRTKEFTDRVETNSTKIDNLKQVRSSVCHEAYP